MYHYPSLFIIFSDFNAIYDQSEKLGIMFCVTPATDFNHFIIEGDLVDVSLGGYSFTRVGHQGDKLNNLDRFFALEEVLDKFTNI